MTRSPGSLEISEKLELPAAHWTCQQCASSAFPLGVSSGASKGNAALPAP